MLSCCPFGVVRSQVVLFLFAWCVRVVFLPSSFCPLLSLLSPSCPQEAGPGAAAAHYNNNSSCRLSCLGAYAALTDGIHSLHWLLEVGVLNPIAECNAYNFLCADIWCLSQPASTHREEKQYGRLVGRLYIELDKHRPNGGLWAITGRSYRSLGQP